MIRSIDRDRGPRPSRDTTRLEAFSDGVLAIAITLLILEIHVPTREEFAGDSALWHELRELWPSYLGYLISFITIGIVWTNHHNIFRYIVRTDQTLTLINTLFLLCVAFIPFPTALVAEYLGHDGERTATMVYVGTFIVLGVLFGLLWWYPTRNRDLIDPDLDQDTIRIITRRFTIGAPVYIVAFLVALISPLASLIICLLVAAYYALSRSSTA